MTSLIADYGLFILFVLVMAESAGVPLPGETALITAAFIASRGDLSIEAVIVVASVAAIVGDNIGYWLGRFLGRNFLTRYEFMRRVNARFLPTAERFFERHGGKSIFLARWFSGVRVAGAWIAGYSRMHWWKFFLWNALGGIFWAATVALLAYWGGQAVVDAFHTYGLIAGLAAVGVVVAAGVGIHFWKKRMVEEKT